MKLTKLFKRKNKRITNKEISRKINGIAFIMLLSIVFMVFGFYIISDSQKIINSRIPSNEIKEDINKADGTFVYPNEIMINNSKADSYFRVLLKIGIEQEIYREYKKNYPKEALVCLSGNYSKEDIILIDSLLQPKVDRQENGYIYGNCPEGTLINLHTHTHQKAGDCRPSQPDLSFQISSPVEGLLCGEKEPEKLIFYDSYRHYLDYKDIEEDYYVYDGYIDTNSFVFSFSNYKIGDDGFVYEV